MWLILSPFSFWLKNVPCKKDTQITPPVSPTKISLFLQIIVYLYLGLSALHGYSQNNHGLSGVNMSSQVTEGFDKEEMGWCGPGICIHSTACHMLNRPQWLWDRACWGAKTTYNILTEQRLTTWCLTKTKKKPDQMWLFLKTDTSIN